MMLEYENIKSKIVNGEFVPPHGYRILTQKDFPMDGDLLACKDPAIGDDVCTWETRCQSKGPFNDRLMSQRRYCRKIEASQIETENNMPVPAHIIFKVPPKSMRSFADVQAGTWFTAQVGGSHEERLYLRTYNAIVDVQNPSATWTDWDALKLLNYLEVKVDIKVDTI